MRYLFFAFVLGACACASSGAQRAPADSDEDDRVKALSVFGVTTTGTGYESGGSIMSIQCVPSVGDANANAKAALRAARDEVVKMHCGPGQTDNFVPADLTLSLSGNVSCVRVGVKPADLKCRPAQ